MSTAFVVTNMCAPVSVIPDIGSTKGTLTISESNKAQWKIRNYLQKEFTTKSRIIHCLFANFAHTDVSHTWIVILCENKTCLSYNTETGQIYENGLLFSPEAVLSCENQGVVMTTKSMYKNTQSIYLLQGPQEFPKLVTPSSTSSPMDINEDLIYFDEHFALSWNPEYMLVTAYDVRILRHSGYSKSTSALENRNDEMDRVAMVSYNCEWSQAEFLGCAFGQTFGSKVISCLDPKLFKLYTLLNEELICRDGVMAVAPVRGVYNLPGAFTIMDNELKFGFLNSKTDFLNVCLPSEVKDNQLTKLESDPKDNWVDVYYIHQYKEVKCRLMLGGDMDTYITDFVSLLTSVLSEDEICEFCRSYLTARVYHNMHYAFIKALSNCIAELDPETATTVVMFLHVYREELLLIATDKVVISPITDFLIHNTAKLGPEWRKHYSSDFGHSGTNELKFGQVPAMLSTEKLGNAALTPPSVFTILMSFLTNTPLPDSMSPMVQVVNSYEKFFPNIRDITNFFQLVTQNANREQIKSLAIEGNMLERSKKWTPGIQICILEVLYNLGMMGNNKTFFINLDEPKTSQEQWGILAKHMFSEDLRLNEAKSLLQNTKPQQCLFGIFVKPEDHTEQEFINQQQCWSWHLGCRALQQAFGDAALHINTQKALAWEQISPPSIDFSGQCTQTGLSIAPNLQSLHDAAISHPHDVFAQGCCLGFKVNIEMPDIDSLWVLTSANLNHTSSELYAGFVYGMGIRGQLSNLDDWQFYESLVTSNTSGTIAALLGVSVSKTGSKDPKLAKVLTVHIPALLPADARDQLYARPRIEQAALVSLGFLYYQSGACHISDILVRELNTIQEDTDEWFSLNEGRGICQGIALGLINIGMKNLQNLISLVNKFEDKASNLPGSLVGSSIALMLNFAGSNDKFIAQAFELPQSYEASRYWQPHTFFFKTLIYHMIMWDDIEASDKWIERHLPRYFGTDPNSHQLRNVWYYQSLCGLLVAIAMKNVGTNDENVIDLLLSYFQKDFIANYKSLVSTMSDIYANEDYREAYTFNQCAINFAQMISTLCLAVSAVAAGSGNAHVLRVLRELWQVAPQFQDANSDSTYGFSSRIKLDLGCVSQAIGWLFLHGGQWSFKTDITSVSSFALFTFIGHFSGFNFSPSAFQHLRFLWVLNMEKRCLYLKNQPSEIVKARVVFKNGDFKDVDLPYLLPALENISQIEITDHNYTKTSINPYDPRITEGTGIELLAQPKPVTSLDAILLQTQDIRSSRRNELAGILAQIASCPKSSPNPDLELILCFYKSWQGPPPSRILQTRDLEKLKMLRFVSETKN